MGMILKSVTFFLDQYYLLLIAAENPRGYT